MKEVEKQSRMARETESVVEQEADEVTVFQEQVQYEYDQVKHELDKVEPELLAV